MVRRAKPLLPLRAATNASQVGPGCHASHRDPKAIGDVTRCVVDSRSRPHESTSRRHAHTAIDASLPGEPAATALSRPTRTSSSASIGRVLSRPRSGGRQPAPDPPPELPRAPSAITAKTTAGLDQPRLTVALVANFETHCVVGSPAAVAAQLGVAPWHELGCDAGANDSAAEALADRLTRAGQQAPRRCRSRDRAGARSSPRISSQLDEVAAASEAEHGDRRGSSPPRPTQHSRSHSARCLQRQQREKYGRNRRLLVRMLERAPRRSRQLSAPPSSRATR